MQLKDSFFIALSTYSRIPVPNVKWTDENRRYALCFFPLIGLAVGLCLVVWLQVFGALALGPVLKGAGAAVIPLLITGGIHMDGLMDTSDALAAWQPPEKRLEILKDSHTGAFAVIACAAYLLLAAGLLSECTVKDAWPLAACFVLSRSLSAWQTATMKQARPGGMLDGFAKSAAKKAVCGAAAGYAAACAAVWLLCLGWKAVLPVCASALTAACWRRMALKCFGGMTGDLAGWLLQMAELACMAGVVLGGKLP